MRNSTRTPLTVRGREGEQVRRAVRRERGSDDDRAAHRGRAALGVVRGGAVVADELAVAAPDEELDEQRGAEAARSPARRRPAMQHGLHERASPSGSVDESVAEPPEPGVTAGLEQHDVAGGAARAASSSWAASASGTHADSCAPRALLARRRCRSAGRPRRRRRAARCRGAPRAGRSRRARRPSPSPSSSISPSTAQVRRPRGPSPRAPSAPRASSRGWRCRRR